MATIEINDQFKKTIELLENTRENIFITGNAGTGKSTLLEYFREHTNKNIVVLAPTGVAAVNVRGQTIHSFFGFKPDITLSKVARSSQELYKKIDSIVIDEISMVRADLFDCIDKFLRINGKNKHVPFGGVQMILIGDLHQLPPVITGDERAAFFANHTSPYFFSANVFTPSNTLFSQEAEFKLRTVELTTIYRQKDPLFISLLNAIRNATLSLEQLDHINTRHITPFTISDLSVYLTTTNAKAAQVNDEKLSSLNKEELVFLGKRTGKFDEKYLPTDEELRIKVGAQVMMLNNDTQGRWINGSVGSVIAHEDNEERNVLVVKLHNGGLVDVSPYRWDIYRFFHDEKSRQIESESMGSFTQFPLKLAWAVTIHKSQGKTFDEVVIDLGRGTFSPGQLYVALSRARTLEGITLTKPVTMKDVWCDEQVKTFLAACK